MSCRRRVKEHDGVGADPLRSRHETGAAGALCARDRRFRPAPVPAGHEKDSRKYSETIGTHRGKNFSARPEYSAIRWIRETINDWPLYPAIVVAAARRPSGSSGQAQVF